MTARNSHPAQTSSRAAPAERVIRPETGLTPINFAELWKYRELLFFLTWRNILIRYKQTLIGLLWAILQPVITMIVLTVVFGRLARFPSHDVPYCIMTLAAVLPWQFFAGSLTQGSNSVVSAQSMVQKIYFPRLYIPASQVVASAFDFMISLLILFAMMLWFRVPIRIEILLLPVFMAVAFLAALGIALLFSALNVKYRDVRHVMPFLIRIGLYLSPVGFMSGVIPEKLRFWYSLNPMVGVIDGFRWAILGSKFVPYWPGFCASLGVVAALFVAGAYYFRATERTFADVI